MKIDYQLTPSALRDELLRTNPKIDLALIKKADELEAELKRLGVDTKPQYQLSPAFDSVSRRSCLSGLCPCS